MFKVDGVTFLNVANEPTRLMIWLLFILLLPDGTINNDETERSNLPQSAHTHQQRPWRIRYQGGRPYLGHSAGDRGEAVRTSFARGMDWRPAHRRPFPSKIVQFLRARLRDGEEGGGDVRETGGQIRLLHPQREHGVSGSKGRSTDVDKSRSAGEQGEDLPTCRPRGRAGYDSQHHWLP